MGDIGAVASEDGLCLACARPGEQLLHQLLDAETGLAVAEGWPWALFWLEAGELLSSRPCISHISLGSARRDF